MPDQTKAPTKGQDAEKTQEQKKRPEPAPEHTGALAAESISLAGLLGDSAMDLPVERHTALLGDPRFSHPANAVQRARMVSELQRKYGNVYVQRVMESVNAQAKLTVNGPDDIYEQEADRVAEAVTGTISSPPQPEPEEEEVPVQMKTEPETAWQRLQEQKLQAEPALTPPTLDGYPSQDTAAGMAVVRNRAWAVWIADNVPACIREGVRLHEQKHVDDFNADPDYRDFPRTSGANNNQTMYYGSNADARRFEHPAIDIEIAWLRNQLEGDLSDADRRIIRHRQRIVLPTYRGSF